MNYSPDGAKIVTGGSDNRVRIWSNSGVLLFNCSGHTGDITQVKVTPDNSFVVSSSKDKTIKIWDIETGNLAQTISGHSKAVNGIDVSPDGTKIVSASSDSSCIIWDFETGNLLSTFGVSDSGGINAVAWSPNGDKIVTGNGLSDLVLWSLSATTNGLNDFDSKRLKLFPNPAQNSFIIEIPTEYGTGQVLIYDKLGRVQKVYPESSHSNRIIETEGLECGVYFVVFQNEKINTTTRLVISK